MRLRHDYHRPRVLDEARTLRAEIADSRYIAGGTDLLLRMRGGHQSPSALISLRSLPDLVGIEANGTTRIGALTTFTDILEHPTLCARYPVLGQAVRRIGCVQIRNVATLGGNLCNAIPCADSAPALLVLGATLLVLGADGEREIPIDEFFVGPRETCLGPEEILTAVRIDPVPQEGRGLFLKKTRVQRDLALSSIAAFLTMSADGQTCREARIAAGSVAPVPLRLRKAEALLEGHEITSETLDRAMEQARDEIAPISDVRASADYRRHLTGVLLKRAVTTLLERSSA